MRTDGHTLSTVLEIGLDPLVCGARDTEVGLQSGQEGVMVNGVECGTKIQ